MPQTDLTLDDLLGMSQDDLWEVMRRAHAIDLKALDDTQYTGIDLSLPEFMHKLLWTTFRKTFHRDPKTGVLRGWNVRVEQTGWEKPPEPKRDRRGHAITFGHYHVLPAEGLRFPRGWTGPQYLDYRCAGNKWGDLARLGYCPLVAVNPGKSDLLLGWEIFRVGAVNLPLPDFWALQLEGPVDHVVPPPRG